MTPAEALKYRDDLNTYAARLERIEHPHATHWRATADAWSKQIQEWQTEAEIKAAVADAVERVERSATAQMGVVLSIAKQSHDSIGRWVEKTGTEHQNAIIQTEQDVAALQATQKQVVIKAAEVEEK